MTVGTLRAGEEEALGLSLVDVFLTGERSMVRLSSLSSEKEVVVLASLEDSCSGGRLVLSFIDLVLTDEAEDKLMAWRARGQRTASLF